MCKFLYGLAIVGGLALPAIFTVAADDTMPLPDDWKGSFHTADYGVAYSYVSVKEKDPNIAYVWHKIHFVLPQRSSHGQISSEAVLIEIDCAKRTVAVLRKLEYAADGTLLSDTKTPRKQLLRENYYIANGKDLSDSAVRKSALADDDDVCRTAD